MGSYTNCTRFFCINLRCDLQRSVQLSPLPVVTREIDDIVSHLTFGNYDISATSPSLIELTNEEFFHLKLPTVLV